MVAEEEGANESALEWAKERTDQSGYLRIKVVLKPDLEEAIKA